MEPITKNYYSILGVSRDADAEAIKTRFHQLAKELHPDGAGTTSQSSIERFKELRHLKCSFVTYSVVDRGLLISEAYQVLKDTQKRQLVDEYLEHGHMRRPFGADESFVDRFAGIRPRSRQERQARPRFLRFMEIALAPRVLVVTAGLGFLGYIAFGPRDESSSGDVMVNAWFNPRTKRWETPAPWNEDFRSQDAVHRKMHSYLVFKDTGGPPPTATTTTR